MSNFSKAAQINAMVGNVKNGGWEAIDHQVDIIASEWDELTTGIEERDVEELRDGIQDMLFTVYGLGHRAGIPVDLDYTRLIESMMTKFDQTEEDAAKTRRKYAELGMEVYQETKFMLIDGQQTPMIVTFSAKDQPDTKGRLSPKGKWLKSWLFAEPRYDELEEQVQLTLGL